MTEYLVTWRFKIDPEQYAYRINPNSVEDVQELLREIFNGTADVPDDSDIKLHQYLPII